MTVLFPFDMSDEIAKFQEGLRMRFESMSDEEKARIARMVEAEVYGRIPDGNERNVVRL